MVSVSTLCTLLSEVRTSRESSRILRMYTLLSSINTGIMATMMRESTLSMKNR